MPKFNYGAPQVTFIKRNGSTFTQTYHSRAAAAASIKAWRSKGGRIKGIGSYDPHGLKSRWVSYTNSRGQSRERLARHSR